jgi:hypothetical protein
MASHYRNIPGDFSEMFLYVSTERRLTNDHIDFINMFMAAYGLWKYVSEYDVLVPLFRVITMCDDTTFEKIKVPEGIYDKIVSLRKLKTIRSPLYEREFFEFYNTCSNPVAKTMSSNSVLLLAMQRRIDALERRNAELTEEIAAMWGPGGPAERMGSARFAEKTRDWTAPSE